MTSAPDLVSFVVPTKDASRTLRACLTSLRRQDHAAVEVVVVDNGSTDGTRTIAAELADVVAGAGPERSAQRNAGARLAHGDALVFVDADMVLEPAVAGQCARALADAPSLGALVLPELSFGTGYLARCRALEKELALGDERVEAARAFRRSAFAAAGGYDESMNAFEDWELADRVRAKGWRVGRTGARVWHDDGRISLRRQFRKKRYYGAQSGAYLASRDATRRRPLARPGLLARPAALLRRPDLSVGLALLKTVELAGIAAGMGARRRAPRPVEPAPCAGGGRRVLHVIAEFSTHEAMGRSIAELAAREPGEHHLLAARVHGETPGFASVHETGGSMAAFPVTRSGAVRAATRAVVPDVVHLHGGPLVALWAPLPALAGPARAATVYAWPRLPSPRVLRRSTLRAAAASQVLRPRTLLTTVVGAPAVARLLRAGGVHTVRSADPGVARRLRGHGIDVHEIPIPVALDRRRARLDRSRPVVVFAGRAETVRGIDTLLDALPLVLRAHPDLVLRLLLLPRPELAAVVAEVARRRFGDHVEVVTAPCADLRAELAAASIAAFPFKFDHVTLPPAYTVAEAMSVGLPVVGTDVACLTAVLRHDVNGVVVPAADARALAAGITMLIDDPARWARLAAGAVATIDARGGRPRWARIDADEIGQEGAAS